MFNYGFGKAILEILYDTAREFSYFKKWLYCDEREKLKPEENVWSRLTNQNMMYENYERHFENVEESSYNTFKRKLRIQYYKELEKTPNIDVSFLNEKTLTHLTYSSTEYVCKFISELIRNIHIIDGELRIEYNFIYDVENKLIRSRTYDEKNMKVIFKAERTLDELVEDI
ncbi:hypothetical protein [Paenibacillus agilis]|uniref:Uncharacterized protein n=1 Tax=Paenibacillus agilis TaxID=3020863 RepID=A0A559IW45_9BACL|nr:hypothetical protein [Paenibacillus agilis]TVX91833.1 hypothetical protein FPZ44_01410 [Paenibacillus agilis]